MFMVKQKGQSPLNLNESPLISMKMFEFLVCPVSGGRLKLKSEYNKNKEVSFKLYCEQSQLSYPINDGIPILIPEFAECI